jgi:hypothetical protein
VSCGERSRAQRTGAAVDVTPVVSPVAHPFVTPPLLRDSLHSESMTNISWMPVRNVSHVARELSSLDPSLTREGRRTKDAYDRLLPIHRLIGHPDPGGYRDLSGRTGADGVSRRRCALRWPRLSLGRALSSRRVAQTRDTSDAPVAIGSTGSSRRTIRVRVSPRPTRSTSRER